MGNLAWETEHYFFWKGPIVGALLGIGLFVLLEWGSYSLLRSNPSATSDKIAMAYGFPIALLVAAVFFLSIGIERKFSVQSK